mgnify:FL=1
MDVVGWLWWLLAGLLGAVWSVVWFLLGGWVSTLAQIGVIVLIVAGYRYGWRRAPLEVTSWLASVARFVWAWMRSRDVHVEPAPRREAQRKGPRGRYFDRRQPGDIRLNVSVCLSLLMLAGLAALAFQ